MAIRYFALAYGLVFLLVGIAGFVPGLATPGAEGMQDGSAPMNHPRLFGLFPVNTLHNLFHLIFGVWGIVAYRSAGGALTYAGTVAVVYGLLTIFGIVPYLNTMFGLIPLYGHDVWLHALLAVPAALFAFVEVRSSKLP